MNALFNVVRDFWQSYEMARIDVRVKQSNRLICKLL